MPSAQSSRSVVYFFPHTPKCAGSTILKHMQVLQDDVIVVTKKPRPAEIIIRKGNAPRRPQFLTGHYLPQSASNLFEGQEIREIALLRDPVSYYQSLYQFYLRSSVRRHRARTIDFDLWYRCQRKNPISHFFLSRYFRILPVREILMTQRQTLDFLSEQFDRFWFVGSYRHCDLLLDDLSSEFGLSNVIESRNVSRDKIAMPDYFRNRILHENRLDQALYDIWADRLWRRGCVRTREPVLPTWSQKIRYEASVCLARIERHLIA
jgi:hypothetical protein